MIITVRVEPDFASFRDTARSLLDRGATPADVIFEVHGHGQTGLFGEAPIASESPSVRAAWRVPRDYVRSAELAVFHRDADRFAVLYRVLHRLVNGEPDLLEIATDPDTARLRSMVQAVRHEEHAMHAFVRFRSVKIEGEEHFVAWYRPDHPILRLAAPFFARRFAGMRWSILGPEESAHWDGAALRYGAGAPRSTAPSEDVLEELFRTYYRAIFNPARVNVGVMQSHLPAKRWADLPEARVIADATRDAMGNVDDMRKPIDSAASAYLPIGRTLPMLRDAASECRACGLCENATQTVFGEGPPNASLMIVGEQPGDEEDLCGRPFVGPSGRVLDEALNAAGLPRESVYVTNAVKHFKWEQRGKRRIHRTPNRSELVACRAWLMAEVEAVAPQVILCLGTSAGRSFIDGELPLARVRGRSMSTPWAEHFVATIHPAAVLRAPPAMRAEQASRFREDVRLAVTLLTR